MCIRDRPRASPQARPGDASPFHCRLALARGAEHHPVPHVPLLGPHVVDLESSRELRRRRNVVAEHLDADEEDGRRRLDGRVDRAHGAHAHHVVGDGLSCGHHSLLCKGQPARANALRQVVRVRL